MKSVIIIFDSLSSIKVKKWTNIIILYTVDNDSRSVGSLVSVTLFT